MTATPSPQILTRHRISSLLNAADAGLAIWEASIRDTLAHDATQEAMAQARRLDHDRAAAMDALTVLTARYLGRPEDPEPEPQSALLFDWDDPKYTTEEEQK